MFIEPSEAVWSNPANPPNVPGGSPKASPVKLGLTYDHCPCRRRGGGVGDLDDASALGVPLGHVGLGRRGCCAEPIGPGPSDMGRCAPWCRHSVHGRCVHDRATISAAPCRLAASGAGGGNWPDPAGGDGLVFSSERSQSLAWAWPAAGIAAVGIATAGSSRRWLRNNAALAVGVLIGAVSLFVEIVLLSRFTGPGQIGAAFSKIGLWLVVGLLVGPLMARLLRAERLISVVKAREDLARELHDGVLQTLAVVQRRSSDAELAALARDQENSLRVYLSDARLIDAAASPRAAGSADEVAAVAGSLGGAEAGADLGTTLRLVAASAERLHNFTVQVVVAADCPPLSPTKIAAISGVVTEALTNAANTATPIGSRSSPNRTRRRTPTRRCLCRCAITAQGLTSMM